ncbi:nose resistant to fluoxetine protein 6-like [Tropilaelaps mercedesae]|uniref:Nose resistant to fluoxetine protein 6-like n=1 Tax=Tropilaelaps mercedesae TaxID=418985 RepID=A0A1V9Y0T8_9ACAR|nr:nose resistant to fluoxetine protein 6-like [Tropilaelaps mercedesae]
MFMTMTSLGSYAQCLSTRVHEDSDNSSSPALFVGQYCGLHVLPNKEVYDALIERIHKLGDIKQKSAPPLSYDKDSFFRPGLRLGLCVPSLCSTEEMKIIVDKGHFK